MQTTRTLADDVSRLPVQAVTAVRVLQLVEDPDTSAADLARAVECDPALSARVLRLANAPYYGLTRRVSTPSQAVVLLGFSTVRGLAVSAAVGLLARDGAAPGGFWPHAVTTAAAASLVAAELGMPRGEAFTAGLLHDLGEVLLWRQGRPAAVPGAAGPAGSGEPPPDHAAVGAQVFESWRFPRRLVRAVEAHHRPPHSVGQGLGRVLIAGQALALRYDPGVAEEPAPDLDEALDALAVPPTRAPRLLADLAGEIASLGRLLGVAQ